MVIVINLTLPYKTWRTNIDADVLSRRPMSDGNDSRGEVDLDQLGLDPQKTMSSNVLNAASQGVNKGEALYVDRSWCRNTS